LQADLPFHYQKYPHDLAPISAELCYVWPVVWEIGGSLRPYNYIIYRHLFPIMPLQLTTTQTYYWPTLRQYPSERGSIVFRYYWVCYNPSRTLDHRYFCA
jgi:hypothetical protein